MRVVLLLCDWAEAVNGKLYVQGAGWNNLAGNRPVTIALALLMFVPWDRTNRPLEIRVELQTEDGEPVEQNGDLVQMAGQLEVGRPPGMRPGTPFNVPLGFNGINLNLQPGRYQWQVSIDGEPATAESFQVVGGNQ